jgi:hypothetical protein
MNKPKISEKGDSPGVLPLIDIPSPIPISRPEVTSDAQ